VSSSAYRICRIYEDYLLAILETFGKRPFFIRDLQEKGIEFPAGRTHIFFWHRGVLREYQHGHPSSWVITGPCREYLERRRISDADRQRD